MMQKSRLLTGVAAIALILATPLAQLPIAGLGATPAMAQSARVSIDVFFDNLDDGRWVRLGGRYVFIPDVDEDWQPYRNGRWVYTSRYGWYFRSSESFAWAVYHYGRWGFDRRIGWYWVPGTVWAPAWVSWRRSDDAIGWAPLPPEGDGYSVNVSVSFGEPPRGYWNFVPADRFLADDLNVVIIAGDDRRDYYDRTQPVGPVIVQNNIVINTVIDIDFVQQVTNQQVTEVEVTTSDNPEDAKANAGGDAIVAVEAPLEAPPEDAAPAEVVEPDQVEAPTASQADEVEETGPADDQAAPPAEGETPDGAAPAEQPADADPAEQPADAAPAEEPADAAPAEEPADAAPAEQPADAAPAEQPADAAPAEEPADAAPAEEPADAAPAEEPADAAPAEEPADAAPAEEPADAAPAEEPADAAPAEQPADAAPAEEPAAEEAEPEEQPAPPAEDEECSAEERDAGSC